MVKIDFYSPMGGHGPSATISQNTPLSNLWQWRWWLRDDDEYDDDDDDDDDEPLTFPVFNKTHLFDKIWTAALRLFGDCMKGALPV